MNGLSNCAYLGLEMAQVSYSGEMVQGLYSGEMVQGPDFGAKYISDFSLWQLLSGNRRLVLPFLHNSG